MSISAETLKTILEDETLTDDAVSLLLTRAEKLAKNHYYWQSDDEPTATELERFYDRYEFEIYDIAKAIDSDAARDGEVEHTELGITRKWDETGKQTIDNALSAIPVKTYVG